MRQNVIAAVSTPPGKGGVAIIRMSGDGALQLADEIFRTPTGKKLSDYQPRVQIYGYIIYNEEKLDDCMISYFTAGHSYTGEETVEISCHGGMLITRTVLETLFAIGAIPAEAGEFTQRAYVNGRLTLTEAEAIGNLLDATGREQIRLASTPARKKLNDAINSIRLSLVDTLSSIYARIDYPEEDLGDFTDEETLTRLESTREELARLCDTYRTGRAINDGINAVLCGKTNVGKSTLYNLLLGEDAAIVTEIEGTTRDLLERSVNLGRVKLNITDTAGIRRGTDLDTVEQIGIERTKQKISDSELIIAMFDLSRPFDEKDAEVLESINGSGSAKICILNKAEVEMDGKAALDTEMLRDCGFAYTVKISAKEKPELALAELTKIVEALFTDEKIRVAENAIVSSARQHGALMRALSLLDTAISAYQAGLPADAASSDVEMALGAISEVDGRQVSESVVNDIFSKFCIGK